MRMKSENVVIVPIYREPDGSETVALRQCLSVLGAGHDIVAVHPESFEMTEIQAQYPQLKAKAFPDVCFKGVEGYNFMMLSPEFYEAFSVYKYMLIYQLDAYVFADHLDEWAAKGFDYVGAPWVANSNIFQSTVGAVVRKVRCALRPVGSTERVTHAQMAFQVGNGGFSLRRIAKMIEVTRSFKEEILQLTFGEKKAQEDVFLSLYVRKRAGINVPGWREATGFAWENNPRRCMQVNGNQLPFGCHGWSRGKAYEQFWKQYIAM